MLSKNASAHHLRRCEQPYASSNKLSDKKAAATLKVDAENAGCGRAAADRAVIINNEDEMHTKDQSTGQEKYIFYIKMLLDAS